MALELTLNGSIAYADSDGTEDSLAVVNFLKTVASKLIAHFKQSVGTSEQVIPLSGISAPGYCLIINWDPTNFVEVRVGTGGAKSDRLDPGGGFCLKRFGSGSQVPYIIADTAACACEFFIAST
jgi:hypothetical protein